jgi:hypothetical protein
MLLVHLCGIAKRKKEPIGSFLIFDRDLLFQSECRIGNKLPFVEDIYSVKTFSKVFS